MALPRLLDPQGFFIKRSYAGFAFVFVLLCGLHVFSFRPLWLDEQFILENIRQYPGAELFRVLDNSQAFPRVHLLLIQAFARPFDFAPWALRLPSLFFMLAALALWQRLYRDQASDGFVAWVALLAFAVAYKMSYYAFEFKPYAADVLAFALACSAVLWQGKAGAQARPSHRDFLLGGLFPLTILFSYGALFVCWIPAYNYCLTAIRNKSFRILAVFCAAALAAVFILFYFIDLRYSAGHQGLHDYWRSYFIATDSLSGFFDTFGDGLKKIVTYWYGTSKFHIRALVIAVPFFLFGLYRFGFRRLREDGFRITSLGGLTVAVFAELILLGLLKKYPFTGERITLFFAPAVFWMLAEAFNALRRPGWLRWLFLGYYLVFCAACLVNTFIEHFRLY